MKPPLFIIAGPTAVGKTGLSIRLAKAIDGSVVSADSMQIYRGMDIGTAKIKPEEMEGIPHYLIDTLDPKDPFNVASFKQFAREACEDIRKKGRIPILVGGTGFYIQALLYDVDFSEAPEDAQYRKSLEAFADENGAEALHKRLKEVDPLSADAIHPNNCKRVIRALEFYHASGKPISEHNETEHRKESPFRFRYFVLTKDRKKLYADIDRRVDIMLAAGLVDEVKHLKAYGCTPDMTSMQGIGYRETLNWLETGEDISSLAETIKRNTRHFAKRQLTWFRREKDVIWIDKEQYGNSEDAILAKILEEGKDLLC